MKKILLPVFTFILIACATQTPAPVQVTVTPEATATATFTATPTLTPTPTITFTPTPQLPTAIILDIESRFPGYTVEGNAFKDSKGNILSNLIIESSADGTTWRGIVPPYEYEHVDEEGQVTKYTMTVETHYKAEEFSVDGDGNLSYPAHEWRENEETGKFEWMRKTMILNEGKSEEEVTEFALVSNSEMANVLLAETGKLITKLKLPPGQDLPEEYLKSSISNMQKLIQPDHGRTTYQGVDFSIYIPKKGREYAYLSTNVVYVADSETGENKLKRSLYYHFIAIENDKYGMVAFFDAEGKRKVFFTDTPQITETVLKDLKNIYFGID